MKILIPVDSSRAPLAPVARLVALHRAGVQIEALVLNVQPRFSRHIAQFTSRAARQDLRAERSREAMAETVAALSAGGVPFRTLAEVGMLAERIAAVAAREKVDEIVMGAARQPGWVRYAVPVGAASLAALLLTAE